MAGFFRGNSAPTQDLQNVYGGVGGARNASSRVPPPSVPARGPSTPGSMSQGAPPVSASSSMAGSGRAHAAETRQPHMMRVVKAPQALNTTNCVILNPEEWGHTQYVVINGRYTFTARPDNTRTIQPRTIGTALLQRQWAALSAEGQDVSVEAFDPQQYGTALYLGGVDLEVDFLSRSMAVMDVFDAEEMQNTFLMAMGGHILSTNQILVFEFHGHNLRATVRGLASMDQIPGSDMGLVTPQTQINFSKAPNSTMQLKASGKRPRTNAILQPNFKFEDMGIGGLDTEFSAIFRRAFASRIFPPDLVEKLGIQHVKGLLLYGPPGTGKTLMARQIGKMLNAGEPKVVNGPEILSKYVGASEENIRNLFAEAEAEQKAKGDESGLHIIIFDELDAICKQRGSTGGGTGVGDSVVNQLLSKMDGVDQLNNILLIGMTNRLDMIDEALLRPGRLEVHMEINLPDEHGRLQILNIQTAKMRGNNIMDRDVKLDELATLTKNFSGAEIAGLVKSATSFAFNRHVKVGTVAGISEDVENMRVNREDFLCALDEVKPAFGVAEEELQQVVRNGIMHYAPHIDVILRDGQLRVEQVRTSARTSLVTALLHGPPGSGKTALAATMAMASDFPFIKLVAPENMVGMNEQGKISYLNKVFNDAYKSPLSIIVLDSLEKIIEWNPIGPRFSNPVLQSLAVLLGKQPPKDRRLLVLGTTSNKTMLTEMDLGDAFLAEIRVPNITSLRSVDHVLRETSLFDNESAHARCLQLLAHAGLGQDGRLSIGIKKLLSEIEMARLDADPADKLAAALNFL
ncbi:vesicle-fusing ATPase [Malassezia psittaci]|uniref:Vesicular-fusion protein SEC18 n=1 Tax=Malassezia psittaci TaxID=1821823 RepID=A0AAF0F6W3_9BASI|nr:vesicle-fusing ATPase [Malassezia psittaci]